MKNLPPIAELSSLSRKPKTCIRWHQEKQPFRVIDGIGRWSVRLMIVGGAIATTLALLAHFKLVMGVLLAITFLGMWGCLSAIRG